MLVYALHLQTEFTKIHFFQSLTDVIMISMKYSSKCLLSTKKYTLWKNPSVFTF